MAQYAPQEAKPIRKTLPTPRAATDLRSNLRDVARGADGQSSNFLPNHVQDVIRSPGSSLEPGSRAGLERRFGFDFSQIRIHTDEAASASAGSVNAAAYTVGPHIAFRAGRYAPGSEAGEELLAHEAAHVVQQSRGGPRPPYSAESAAEAGAARAADGVMRQSGRVEVAGAYSPGLARQTAAPEESLEQMEASLFGPANPDAKQNLARMIESLGGKSYDVNLVSYDKLAKEYFALKEAMIHKAPAAYAGPSIGAVTPEQEAADRKAMTERNEAERREKHPNGYDVMVSDSQRVGHAMNPSGVDPIQAATSLGLRAAGVKRRKAEAIGAGVSLVAGIAGTVRGGLASNRAAGRPLAPIGEQWGSPVEGASPAPYSEGQAAKPETQVSSEITPPSHQLESGITPPSHQLESGITPPSRQLGSGITPTTHQLGPGPAPAPEPPGRGPSAEPHQPGSGITPPTHQLGPAKGPVSIFDSIKPLGPNLGGTAMPRAFEITTYGGRRFFVNGSATVHFNEAMAGYREYRVETGRGDKNPSAVMRTTHFGVEPLGPVELFPKGSGATGQVRPGAGETARGSTTQTFRDGVGGEAYFNRQGPAGATMFASAMVLEDFASSLSEAVQRGIPYNTPTVVGNWELILQPSNGPGKLPSVTHALPGGRLQIPGKRALPW